MNTLEFSPRQGRFLAVQSLFYLLAKAARGLGLPGGLTRGSAEAIQLVDLRAITLAVAGLILVPDTTAQELIPAKIEGGPHAANQVSLSWPAIPGRTYEVMTRDGLEAPWLSTNLAPMRARSTQASASDSILDPSVPIRFYQIRAQPVPAGNTNAITTATVAEVEKVLGLTFTPGQRSQLLSGLASRRSSYGVMRKTRLLNSDSPVLIFDPRPPGFTMPMEQKLIVWSAPKNLSVPTGRNKLAFYTVRDLGELIRTRQITSTELTQLYLERIKRHDAKLKSVITLTEELAMQQAARADEELAAG